MDQLEYHVIVDSLRDDNRRCQIDIPFDVTTHDQLGEKSGIRLKDNTKLLFFGVFLFKGGIFELAVEGGENASNILQFPGKRIAGWVNDLFPLLCTEHVVLVGSTLKDSAALNISIRCPAA